MKNNDLLPKGEDIVEQARRYADEELWDEAIETYKKALVGNPTDADLYNDLGIAFDEAGKLTEAEQAYQKATELDLQFSAAFYNLGLMYEEQSRFPEAVEAYQKCIKYSKNPTECSAVREKLIAMTSDTPTGQSSLAYRIAACLLILGVLMNIVGLLVVGTTLSTPIVISGVVDFILVIGLFKLRTWARNLTYGRAFLGAIVLPIWYFLVVFKANILLTLLVSVVQWGYCGSLILLLTGQSKVRRLIIAVAIFLIFVCGLNAFLTMSVYRPGKMISPTSAPTAIHLLFPPPLSGTPVSMPVTAISEGNAERVIQLACWGKGTVEKVTWLPDGRLLAAISSVGIYLYDLQTLTEVRLIETHGPVYDVAFSPDWTMLASGGTPGRLWRVSDGDLLYTLGGEQDRTTSVAFSPNGKLLASGSMDGTVRLWRVSDGALLHTEKRPKGSVFNVAFSPDGTLLASGSFDPTIIELWRVSDGAIMAMMKGHTQNVLSVAFSPNGRLLASGSYDHTVRLWRVLDGFLVRTLEEHTDEVNSVAFSPDGTLLASGSRDTTVRLWRVLDGTRLSTLVGHLGSVSSVAFSPDGKLLASGSEDGTVRIWGILP